MEISGIKKGNITFDFSDNKGILIIDLGHKLSNYERLQVLKEIINEFCVYNSFLYALAGIGRIFPFNIEYMIFKDKYNNDADKMSIIMELFSYDLIGFELKDKNESVIARVKESLDIIEVNSKRGKKCFRLQSLNKLKISERRAYIDLLYKYIKMYSKEQYKKTYNIIVYKDEVKCFVND